MTILKDVFAELFGMFLSDAPLSTAVLAVVAVSAGLIDFARLDPLVGGGVLLGGCLAAVVESVRRTARRRHTNVGNRSQ